MSKRINKPGSPMARDLFSHCPAMVRLGKQAATICAKNKITTREELAEFLAVSGQVEELLKQKNVGELTIEQLFEAIGLPSPFTPKAQHEPGSQGQAIANLIVRVGHVESVNDRLDEVLDDIQQQLANLATQHEALRSTVERINDRT